MTEQEELKALILAGEAITEKSKQVTIIHQPKNLLDRYLMKAGLIKRSYVFKISPILVGNRYRISAAALRIKEDIFTDGRIDVNKCWRTICDHTEDYLYIVAVCIQNSKKEPSKALIECLRWLPDTKFYDLLDKSLSMAGIPSFMNSTLLIKGSNVLSAPEKAAVPAAKQD